MQIPLRLLFALLLVLFPCIASAKSTLRVALFADKGSSDDGIQTVEQQLKTAGMDVVRVKGSDIAANGLPGFDVVMFTGGAASTQAESLGEQGRENVRAFVRDGGGYIGICAGAYLACTGFDWGVGVLDAKTVDPRWQRGSGVVQVEVTSAGQAVTGLEAKVNDIYYLNGPILMPHGRDPIPPYETVAFFRTELADNGTPKGIMLNSPAIARGSFGKGRVVVSSPHPERTKGLKASFVPSAVRWVAGDSASATAGSLSTTKPTDVLEEKLRAIQKKYSIVGLSAVAVKDGQVVWNTNMGLADLDRKVPVTDRTKFRIASISKTVATAALMQLWEKDKFKLDDDISRYLGYPVVNPRFPDTPITFRQLLTHTSSLTDNDNYDRFLKLTYDARNRGPELKEILTAGGSHYNDGANFSSDAPGTSYRYCNLAFGLVGTLVEKISGERFDSYCNKNILAPLGMTASFNVADLPDVNDLGVLYNPDKDDFKAQVDDFRGVKPANRIGPDYKPGHNAIVFAPQGGLRVSAHDLSKFMVQFMDPKPTSVAILKPSTIDIMTSEHWSNGKKVGEYEGRGLGFDRTVNLVPGEMWIGHTGSAYGLRSSMYFNPKKSVGVILITNGSKPGEREREFYPMQRETADAVLQLLQNGSTW